MNNKSHTLCFSYDSMKSLCDKYNRAIDSILQLVSENFTSKDTSTPPSTEDPNHFSILVCPTNIVSCSQYAGHLSYFTGKNE